jgi:hypothetical protein
VWLDTESEPSEKVSERSKKLNLQRSSLDVPKCRKWHLGGSSPKIEKPCGGEFPLHQYFDVLPCASKLQAHPNLSFLSFTKGFGAGGKTFVPARTLSKGHNHNTMTFGKSQAFSSGFAFRLVYAFWQADVNASLECPFPSFLAP